MCCSTTATQCNTLQQWEAGDTTQWRSCGVFQCDAAPLQHTATHCNRGKLVILQGDGDAENAAPVCVAVCCSVLQCVAACCSVLQRVAVCCRVLQCGVVCCSVQQCVALANTNRMPQYCRFQNDAMQHTAIHCSALQHTTSHYNTDCNTRDITDTCRPRISATHHNTLQHSATLCNMQHPATNGSGSRQT